MSTPRKPGKYACTPLPDEPNFLILGRDRHGAAIVREWASQRELAIEMGLAPESDRPKVADARRIADQMEAWRAKHWAGRRGAKKAA